MQVLNEFLSYLKEQGWHVELNQGNQVNLPTEIHTRYANIPQAWFDFIRTVQGLKNSGDTTWFLCADDFKVQPDDAFQWNEWERISLESAEHDAAWAHEITEFWDNHLPILLSVHDGYSYYAISMQDGSIVQGEEPEFEVCTKAANSLDEFMQKVIQGEIQIQ